MRGDAALASRRNEVAVSFGLGLLGAVSTVVWAVRGADYIHDDFHVHRIIEREGIVQSLWHLGFEAPARPLAAPFYVVQYQVIGRHPLAQCLLLALLNAGVVVLAWRVARELVSPRAALWTALVFAVAPNRASTRLWFVIAPYVLVLALTLLGALLILRRDRLFLGGVVIGLSVLVYEGIAAVGFLIIIWYGCTRRKPPREIAAAVTPLLVTAAALFILSPKRSVSSTRYFDGFDGIGQAVIGSGFWGSHALGAAAGSLVVFALVLALVSLLPRYRPTLDGEAAHGVRVGGAVLAAAVLPFAVAGSPFAVSGVFDRNNLAASLATATIVGSLLGEIIRRWRRVGSAIGVAIVFMLAAAGLDDVDDYRSSVRDGDELIAHIIEDVSPGQAVVVGPPLEPHRGVVQLIRGSDLTDALILDGADGWDGLSMPAHASECQREIEVAHDTGRPLRFYDRIHRVVLDEVPLERCGAPDR